MCQEADVMVYHASHQSMFLIWLACLAICDSGIAAVPETNAGEAASREGGTWQQQIADLEAKLFDPLLPPVEVDRLLEELQHAKTRPEAVRRLGQQGQGHVNRAIAFARQCPDIEVRQACVNIVEALDASYRTTELGERLGALYREHAEALLPAYWARFRHDPLDPRAVAMLMHADAAATYAALAATGDRHDRLRYLLLRIRELSPDEFAQKHIFEHTASGARLVLADVLPSAGYHRIVGQIGITRIAIISKLSGRSDLPEMTYVSIYGSSVYVYSYPPVRAIGDARTVAVLTFPGHTYGPERISLPVGSLKENSVLPDLVCPLPHFDLTSAEIRAWSNNMTMAPWWVQSYVPQVYRQRVHFASQPPEAAPPEETAKVPIEGILAPKSDIAASELSPSAPSVVFLPPRLLQASSSQMADAAGLACDRLAQEIAAAGLARVVDRLQVDRLLRERALAPGPLQSMVSFDVMIRLEVDAPALVPAARLSLIDLSHGNVLSEARYDWPLREADVPRMFGQCDETFALMGRRQDGTLKVRCLSVANPERNPRIAPLVARLEQVFTESIARSPRLVPVHYLEAASAKEESLLLWMGLSQLPGERRFVPQADATIELSMQEENGVGKTFERTPIDITVHVVRGDAVDARPLVTNGTVAEFDRAVAQAWEKLADVLREAQPAAAADWFSDTAVRRQQAEAELRVARAIVKDAPLSRDEQILLARMEHTESALKLDPTFAEAAYEHLAVLGDMCGRSFTTSPADRTDDLAERTLDHAVRCLGQFGAEAAGRTEIHNACRIALHASLGHPSLSKCLRWTPQRLRMVQHARRILEDSVRRDGFSRHLDCHAMTPKFVVRGMRHAGVPLDERDRWVDWVLKECVSHEPALPRADDPRDRTRRALHWLWLHAAELAVEDGSFERAAKLIGELKYRIANGFKSSQEPVLPRIRDLFVVMDDAGALAAYDRWLERLDGSTVERLDINWPSIVVFHDEQRASPCVTCTTPPVEGVRFRHPPLLSRHYHTGISALVEGDGRLYVVVSGTGPIRWEHFRASAFAGVSQVVGCISLDDAGRPTQGIGRAGKETPASVWLLPQPEVDKPLHVLDAKHVGGRLFLGTLESGLLVFDVKAETWSSFTPKHGLPAEAVLAIHPLDEQTLFCVGRLNGLESLCYTLELPEGTVTLRHRASRDSPTTCWRDGDELRAWSGNGLYDNLLGPDVRHTPRRGSLPYGWSDSGVGASPSIALLDIAEVDGRWFGTRAGLHEFDAKGTILRSWWGSNQYEGDFGRAFNVSLPPDCPIQGNRMVAAGDLLVFLHRASVLAWAPKTDTWYGPLAVAGAVHAMGTRAGVWLGTEDGLLFVSTDELLRAAQRAGRVMTTDQYRQRQREVIAAMPPLDRAKVAFSMRRFDEAMEHAQTVLENDPDCVEALLLMGYLHDLWCMNRPEIALEYYGRLAKLGTNPNASFTGLYQRFVLLRTLKRWSETLATIDDITGQFPRLHERQQGSIDWWRNHIQKQLAKTEGNQSAAKMSSTVEKPEN